MSKPQEIEALMNAFAIMMKTLFPDVPYCLVLDGDQLQCNTCLLCIKDVIDSFVKDNNLCHLELQSGETVN